MDEIPGEPHWWTPVVDDNYVQVMDEGGAGSLCSLAVFVFYFLIHRFHSISFTRAQGIPKYKIGFCDAMVLSRTSCGAAWALASTTPWGS